MDGLDRVALRVRLDLGPFRALFSRPADIDPYIYLTIFISVSKEQALVTKREMTTILVTRYWDKGLTFAKNKSSIDRLP